MAYGPVIRIELVREGGIVERAEGADAAAIWRGIVTAMNVAESYGYLYSGPKMRLIPPPTMGTQEVAPSIEGEPEVTT